MTHAKQTASFCACANWTIYYGWCTDILTTCAKRTISFCVRSFILHYSNRPLPKLCLPAHIVPLNLLKPSFQLTILCYANHVLTLTYLIKHPWIHLYGLEECSRTSLCIIQVCVHPLPACSSLVRTHCAEVNTYTTVRGFLQRNKFIWSRRVF